MQIGVIIAVNKQFFLFHTITDYIVAQYVLFCNIIVYICNLIAKKKDI